MRLLPVAFALLMIAPARGQQADVKQAPALIERPTTVGVGRKFQSPLLAPLLQDVKLLVVAFAGADCPVSKLYRPRIDQLDKSYRSRAVRFFSVPADDPAFGPLFEVRRTTEVFVVDPGGVLRYRGAIDDQYGIGYRKEAAERNYLVDALEALLAGRAPAVAATEAPGCAVTPKGGPAAAPSSKPTFYKDVAPIFQRRCVDCHRPGEIGPFSLLKVDKARSNARQIKEVVVQRRMPPWNADPKHGEWKNDRRLTSEEIATISSWVDAGAPEGELRDAPTPRKFTEGWTIGPPDAVYRIPRAERIPAEGTIPYRYQYVPTGLREDRWVQAMEVRPGARRVVHHILVFIQYPPDRAREQPAFDGGLFNGYFATMIPGTSPLVFPEGLGKRIPANATLVFQIHYTASGESAEDQSSIGLIWAKKPPRQEVVTRGIVNTQIRIPAGAPAHEEQALYTFTHDARLLSFLPHMHVRGKSFRYLALLPDGKEEILLDVPAFDFNWQTSYLFKEPRLVRKGTRIRAIAAYDNSRNNPANPDPAREVRFGEQTWEEMLIGYMDFVKAGE